MLQCAIILHMNKTLNFRKATTTDLPAINHVIRSAVLNWPMGHGAKRDLADRLIYSPEDMDRFRIIVCDHRREIIGLAAWDPAYDPDQHLGFLHGLYVLPIIHGHGIGTTLMEKVFAEAMADDVHGVIARSERVSDGFFEQHHLTHTSDQRENRFFKDLDAA